MKTILFSALLVFSAIGAVQAQGCTLIGDLRTGQIILESGDECDTPLPPASTFKVPLAVLGFEAGILQDAHNPAWPYRDDYGATRQSWKVTTDPELWLAESVLWYSRVLVAEFGAERFAQGVATLGYGNQDVGGDPGENNGMTRSWLNSSLLITPRQQIGFMASLRTQTLPVSQAAQASTMAIMPHFESGGWQVYGKTGSAFPRKSSGGNDYSQQMGWFAGWMEQGERVLVFAAFDRFGSEPPAGLALRDRFLAELPELMVGL